MSTLILLWITLAPSCFYTFFLKTGRTPVLSSNWTLDFTDSVLDVFHWRRTTYHGHSRNTRHDHLKRDTMHVERTSKSILTQSIIIVHYLTAQNKEINSGDIFQWVVCYQCLEKWFNVIYNIGHERKQVWSKCFYWWRNKLFIAIQKTHVQ